MENYRIYGQNAGSHHERAKIEELSEDFINMLERFDNLCEENVIADIGCGTGRDLKYMHEKCDRGTFSYGVDASSEMVKFARENNNSDQVRYLVSDMSKIPLPDNHLGGIWCQATIFMVGFDKMIESLEEFNRVLDRDGLLSVSFKVSDEKSSKNGEQTRERWDSKVDYYFVDDDKASGMLESTGFKILDMDRTEFGSTKFVNIWAEAE